MSRGADPRARAADDHAALQAGVRLLKAVHTATHPAATMARPAGQLEAPAASFLAAKEKPPAGLSSSPRTWSGGRFVATIVAMVATAPASPSSLAGLSAQGRNASRIASDRQGATGVSPENDVSEPLARRPEHAAAVRCIGRPRPHRRDSHRGRRRFSGQTRSGRYSWARYYHPGLQRFISEDPIEFAGGDTNLYAYVLNDPVNLSDPSGEIAPVIAAAVACGAGAIGGAAVVLSGRKPTLSEVAIGATIGCGGGLAVLGAWAVGAAAIGAATASEATGGVIFTAVTMREALMKSANHPGLVRVIDQLYRPGAKIGDGGTVDYIRRTGHAGHIRKAVSRARQLEGMLRDQVLDAADSHLARVIIRELRSVIPGSNK